MDILKQLGAKVSPDLNAYASGALPAHMVRCVLCGQAPCKCQFCQVMRENRYHLVTGRPQFEECQMRIDPATGQCPRGHDAGTCATCEAPRGATHGCEECSEWLAEFADVANPAQKEEEHGTG